MSDRRKRLRELATPTGMKRAWRVQQRRRGSHATHRYIVGRFTLDAGRVTLEAVAQGPAMNILHPVRCTATCRNWYWWRTRQAAQQFIHRHALRDVHSIDTVFLDILTPRH